MIKAALAVITAAIAAMTALGIWWIAATPRAALPVGYRLEEFAVYVLIQLGFGSVGLLLAAHRPRNPIGWLFLATALLAALVEVLSGYALSAIAQGRPEGLTVAWIYNLSPTGFTLFVIPAIVLFPTGRPSTRSGRAALWLLPFATLGPAAFVSLRPGPMFNMPSVQNPYALSEGGPGVLIVGLFAGIAFAVTAPLVVRDLVIRFRAASGVLRQQLKWLLWTGLLFIVTTALAGLIAIVAAGGPAGGLLTYVARATFAVVQTTLPVAVGIAVLRHRLYDIDLLIKGTLVYGVLSAVLVVAYAGLVILLGALLRPLTGGSEIAVAGSTLLVVALVQPLRRRIQDAVDRRFYRARYDAARTLDAFTSRLRDEVDLLSVQREVLGVVGETVQPAHARLWLRNAFRTPGA